MRRALLLLVCLALAPWARAEAEDDAAFVDLAGCVVLASPGTPEGLHPFLPGGRTPRALTWPLPDGPLLLFGLPGTDDAARDLAFFWDLLAPGEALHGGYLVAAWHDGTRPIGVILGDDAAALYAARFELEAASPPGGMPATALDFTKPPAETGLRIRRGRHAFRPRFRIRAFLPDRVSDEAVIKAIAGRANQFWIDADRGEAGIDALPRLARHGVAPCVVLPAGAGDEPEAVELRAAPWIRRGVRHLALVPAGFEVGTEAIGRHVAHLRGAYDLAEIVVVGDVIRVPGALGTWLPGPIVGDGMRALHGGAAVGNAGVPLLFVESWASASRTPVPSRPRGRPPWLGRRFAGVLVLDGPGATGILEDAWAPADRDTEEWESVLLPLLPRGVRDPRAFLEQTAKRLADLDAATRGVVDWMDPLLGRVRSSVRELPDPTRCVLVPRAPTPVHLDGALDERAWAYAARLEFAVPRDPEGRNATLLSVADGHGLHLALRLPADLRPLPLVLSMSARSPEPGRAIGDGTDTSRGAIGHASGTRTWEGALGHFDLAGDAHPTRVFHLWHVPEEGPPRRLGSLVLGP